MVVHSSICNPWFYSFFGTLVSYHTYCLPNNTWLQWIDVVSPLSSLQAMAVGQLFGEELYTVMSNAGVLIFIITILLVMAEVDKDIVNANDVACFLVQVSQKGDQIRVSRSIAYPSAQPQQHDPPFQEEEKRAEDEEHGPDTTGAAIPVETPSNSERVGNLAHDEKKEEKTAQEASSNSPAISSTLDEDFDKKNGFDEENMITENEVKENPDNVSTDQNTVDPPLVFYTQNNVGDTAEESCSDISWSFLDKYSLKENGSSQMEKENIDAGARLRR